MRRLTAASIATITLGLLAAPLTAGAQQAMKGPRVGVLWPYSPTIASPFAAAFRQSLRELGYVEGQSIAIEERWAEGRLDRLPALAAELVRLKVDIIVATATPAMHALQQATRTIPIVMALITDPVGSGFVASLARPGGNVTGMSLMHPELSGKRLELLRGATPKVSRVAVLWNPANSSHPMLLRETEIGAQALGVQLQRLEVRDPYRV